MGNKLKLYKTRAEASADTTEKTWPMISLVEEELNSDNRGVEIKQRPYILCRYEVTAVPATVKIVHNISICSGYEVNGEYQSASNNTFETNKLGTHVVKVFYKEGVTNISDMFYGCGSLTSLDLSSFDTSKVTDMGGMFQYCSSLTSLDLSSFDTSKVTSMKYMFYGCGSLTSLDLSNFNTSNVTSMYVMFRNSSGLTSLDLSSFDTSKVTDMGGMFQYCSSLTSLDLSNFNTSNVTNMQDMFGGCYSLTSIDVSNFNTSNVTFMNYMFLNCSGLTSLDLSNFDTSKVTNMIFMFDGCKSLTSITFGSQADVSKVTLCECMFYNITTTGTLYYPQAYESAWKNIIVTNKGKSCFPSTWTAQPIGGQ